MNPAPVHVLTWSSAALLPLVRSLGRAGLAVQILSSAADPALRWSRHVRGSGAFGDRDDHALLAWLAERAAGRRPVLLPNDVQAMRFVARHRDALSADWRPAPVPPPAALEEAADKRRFYERVKALGLPTPAGRSLVCGRDGAESAAAGLRFPVVVKPADGCFGHGVRRCEDARALAAGIAAQAPGAGVIVQELVSGTDVDLSLLALDGRIVAWTTQRALAPAGRFGAPSPLVLVEPMEALREVVAPLVAAWRWSGVAHVDAVQPRGGGPPQLLECNPRFWGSVLASTVAGVNFPALMVRAALGEAPAESAPGRRTRYYSEDLGLRRYVLHRDHPTLKWRETGLPWFAADPGPEVFCKLRHLASRAPRPALLAGLLVLALQGAAIFHARRVPERWFCWAPFDEATLFEVSVTLGGRELSPAEVSRRYRYRPAGWEHRTIHNVLDMIRQHEGTYGRAEDARVTVEYSRNGAPPQRWQWPAP